MTTHQSNLPPLARRGHRVAGAQATARLFPGLPAHQPRDPSLEEDVKRYAHESRLIRARGFDRRRDLNARIPAGYTYLGQFLAHDLSFDPSSLSQRTSAGTSFRTPRLDLDSLYGGGPDLAPQLYTRGPGVRRGGRYHFVLRGSGALAGLDLPRLQERAVIADPRNDSHGIIAQLTVAFMRFHNAIIDHLSDRGEATRAHFDEAHRLTRWHYQWLVLHDFLPRITGNRFPLLKQPTDPFDDGRILFDGMRTPQVPVEFSIGTLRIGHAMVRVSYPVNRGRESSAPVVLPDLLGGRALDARDLIAWNRFVAARDETTRPLYSRRICRAMAASLDQLEEDEVAETRSVPERDLLRGWSVGVPSGQDIARALGVPRRFIVPGDDPLWYYALKEAEEEDGTRAGPVASRILGEVLLGILRADPDSYLSRNPAWRPGLRGAQMRFELLDLLTEARMPMSDEDVEEIQGTRRGRARRSARGEERGGRGPMLEREARGDH